MSKPTVTVAKLIASSLLIAYLVTFLEHREVSAYGPGYGGAIAGGGPGYGTQPAYGAAWGSSSANVDWNRFYHYPYVYYPQNFWGQDYYKSADSLYHRYPTEMRIPVYNKKWHNYYPSNRRFHQGHHFILDTF